MASNRNGNGNGNHRANGNGHSNGNGTNGTVNGSRQHTPEERAGVTEHILTLVASGTSIQDACQAVGINRATFFRWRQADERINERLTSALTENISQAYSAALREGLGFEYTETTRERARNGQLAVVKTVTKYARSNVAALDLWLRNRDKDYIQRMPSTVAPLDLDKLRASLRVPTPLQQGAKRKRKANERQAATDQAQADADQPAGDQAQESGDQPE